MFDYDDDPDHELESFLSRIHEGWNLGGVKV